MNKALEEAAAWYARMHAPDCRLDDRREFKQWLEQNPENAKVYAAAERLAADLAGYAEHDARLLALAEEALAQPSVASTSSRSSSVWWKQAPLALAASILMCALVVFVVPEYLEQDAQTLSYDTPREQREVVLDDGTLTTMDVNSVLTVTLSAKARDVTLSKGRAIFDVAHDARRPFSVAVGTSRVTALGTRFQVQTLNNKVIVTLEEGSVEVINEVNGRKRYLQLRPGEQLRFTQGVDSWMKSSIETDVATSWSKGRHVFRSTTLLEALAEVNRYSVRKVRIGDSGLENLTVSGNFAIGDSRSIVMAFAAALPIRFVEAGNELVLFSSYSHANQLQSDYVQ